MENVRHKDGRPFIRWNDGRGNFLVEIHIVVKGDTLWKIARQYGIPFEELKRANAHLAKSEYIVPGMKIFLPNKVHGGKQEHVKHPGTGKVPMKPTHPTAPAPKPPSPKPTPPTHPKPTPPAHPKPTPPTHPKPTPPAHPKPTPPTHPKPTPPTHPKPTPPAPTPKPTPRPPAPPVPTPAPQVPRPPIPVPTPPPMPVPPPVPTPPPTQTCPMPPFVQHIHPMIGIPCGWMPIFDADCHPFMHSGQIQAMPSPPAFEQPAPLPLPMPSLPSTQFPMYEEECEESPIFSSQGPAMLPQQMPMVEGWQLIESPDYLCEESPDYLCEESPEMDLQPSAWCPPEQGYIPQSVSPAMQQGFPMMPFPAFHQGCGCGCDGHQHHQHQQPMMMMMPLFYGHPCNCQSSMQPMPYQMMPTPYQGSNWYGSY